ncbi:MAG: hypothetical protein GXW89_16685 [Phycisphaerae bacterium]|nr:hypothetical protein [Phycisphaerae bacterium]
MMKFQSAEHMRSYLTEQGLAAPPQPYYFSGPIGGFGFTNIPTPSTGFGCLGGGFGCAAPLPLVLDGTLTNATGSSDGRASGEDVFSTTNVQEAGVDEADMVKSDGTHFFLLRGQSVRIVRAVPADQMVEVGRLDLPTKPGDLYLRGNTLIALSPSQPYGYWYQTATKAYAFFIDVADPAAPVLKASLQFDGSLASSRLIDQKLYLVLTARMVQTDNVTPASIEALPLESWLPDCQVATPEGTVRSGDAFGWEDSYYPPVPMGSGLTAVITIDVDNPTADFAKSAIVGDAVMVYASTSALYVAGPSYTSAGDATAIHKFDLTGESAAYVGSGTVPGHLLNQYSLGESNGYLRVATSTGWLETNGVYVLAEGQTAGTLDIVGKIENIAPGERLYSARFVGDRGFLVTFKKIDPLFTVDLTEPTNPRLVGELKVPGYSDYIHLMDENHLITIGKDTYDMSDFAWYQGVQLSIFDVTDFANPALMHKEIIGVRGTESEALYNPKAFNYFAPKSALAIPIALAEGPTNSPSALGQTTFLGLYVYNVTLENGFQLLGRMSTDSSYYWYGAPGYTRGLFVGDHVYAATQDQVSVAPLGPDLAVVKSITLSD